MKIMAATLEFYAGDPERIAEAVRKLDLDRLNTPSNYKMKADLSLHIQPKDLDTLSKEAGSILDCQPILLRASFQRILCDEPDHGAMLIDDKWVAQFAAINIGHSDDLTEKWMRALATEYNAPEIRPTESARAGVAALIKLCHYAHDHLTPVIHVWYL